MLQFSNSNYVISIPRTLPNIHVSTNKGYLVFWCTVVDICNNTDSVSEQDISWSREWYDALSKDSENLINYTFHLNIQHIFVVCPTTANKDGWAKCAMQINNIWMDCGNIWNNENVSHIIWAQNFAALRSIRSWSGSPLYRMIYLPSQHQWAASQGWDAEQIWSEVN